MKARRSTVLDLIFLLILVGVIVAGAAIGQLRYRYSPSVEHESAFLRNYSPRPVMESFAFKQDPPSTADGVGSGAGGKFVTPPLAEGLKEIRASIVISEKWFPQEPGAVRASLELQ
jgi:hypothetical protein